MTRRQPSNYDIVEDLTAHLALAAWLSQRLDDWQGPSSASGLGVQTNSDTSTVEAAAVRHVTTDEGLNPGEQLVADATRFAQDVDRLKDEITRLNAARHHLEPLRQQHMAHAVRGPSTVGFCEACGDHADGSTPYLSLYDGLDGKCRQAFDRCKSDTTKEAFITSKRRASKTITGRR